MRVQQVAMMAMQPPDPRLAAVGALAAASLPDEPDAVVERLNRILAAADAGGHLQALRSTVEAAAHTSVPEGDGDDLPRDARALGRLWLAIGSSRFVLAVGSGATPPHFEKEMVGDATMAAGDCELRVDKVQTIRDIMAQRVSPPALLARRKIALKGSISTLQRLGRGFESLDAAAVLSSFSSDVLGIEVVAALAETRTSPSFAESWIPDEAASVCGGCHRGFTLVRRRHHCRSCGGVFCNTCAPSPPKLCVALQLGRRGAAPLRQCYPCRDGRLDRCSSFAASIVSNGNVHVASSQPSGAGSMPTVVAGAFAPNESSGAASVAGVAEVKRLEEEMRKIQEVRLQETMMTWAVQSGVAVAAVVLGQVAFVSPALSMGWSWLAKLQLATAAFTVLLVLYVFFARESLLRRRLRIFWMAVLVFLRFKSTRIRTQNLPRNSEQYELIWDETHRLIAFFAQAHFKELRGFWVKLGQYCSSRADILPGPYVEYLGRLQDQMPSDPFEQVMDTIRSELGDEMTNTLVIDKASLASASVAQVHRAKVRATYAGKSVQGDEREVVVKVQHDGIDVIMGQDISSFEIILNVVAWVEPDFDLRPLVEEWKKASREELDFHNEAENQTRARKSLEKVGLDKDVLIPCILPEYTRRRVLVMDYIDGVKIKDVRVALPGLDIENLVRTVVEAFAFQVHIDGHFNGDPHPGNLLVERSTLRPVMLDWGLCKTFTPQKRLAFAKMVHAVDAQDIWTMMDSFEEMGFKFKADGQGHLEPATALEVMRFILRDSATGDTKEVMSQRVAVDEKKFHNDKKLKRKDPVEQFSGEVLFFFRTVDCLQGLCSGLGVQLPFLSILAKHARLALLHEIPSPARSPHAFMPACGTIGERTCIGPLQDQLGRLLSEFCRNGRALGVQACVVASGTGGPRMLANVAAGILGPLDPRPIGLDTLFVTHGLAQLPLAVTLLQLMEQGAFGLDTRLSERWPAFADPGTEKETISVGQVMERSTGLWHVFPKGLQLGGLFDLEKMLKALECAMPSNSPGTTQAHHYWTFGLLAVGICRHLADRELRDCWKATMADLLPEKLRDELLLCGAAQGTQVAPQLPEKGVEANVASIQKPPSDGVDVAELMAAITRMEMEVNAAPDDPAWRFFENIMSCEHLLDPQLYNKVDAKRAEALCGQGVHASARALATLVERCAAAGNASMIGCGVLAAAAASRDATEAVGQRLPPPSIVASLRDAPAPLPGILSDIFEEALADGEAVSTLGARAFFHTLGFQALPAVAAVAGRREAAGLRAPESGAIAAWLPARGGHADSSADSGVSVCVLGNRLDVEACGLTEAVLKLIAAST